MDHLRSEDTSYLPRTSGGSRSIRWNIVGTIIALVTRCFSISSRMLSARTSG